MFTRTYAHVNTVIYLSNFMYTTPISLCKVIVKIPHNQKHDTHSKIDLIFFITCLISCTQLLFHYGPRDLGGKCEEHQREDGERERDNLYVPRKNKKIK